MLDNNLIKTLKDTSDEAHNIIQDSFNELPLTSNNQTKLSSSKESIYFMDDDREGKRLASKVKPDIFLKKYIAPFLRENSIALDVGCGPGIISKTIAKYFPNSLVFGIDISSKRIQEAKRLYSKFENLNFQLANAEKLPFKKNKFNLVFTRFLLEYSKCPLNIIQEMYRVCSPGGTIILQDIDGQLCSFYPDKINLEPEIKTILNQLKETGFDPFIGRKLFYYAKQIGLKNIKVDIEPYNLFAGKIDEKNYNLWDIKMDIAMPEIEKALGSKNDAIKFKKKYMDLLLCEDTLYFSNLFTISGEK